MTKGAFYNAFKSKEEFLLRCLAAYATGNTTRILGRLASDGKTTALERLKRFYNEMLEMQPRKNNTGCMVNNMMSELGISNPLVSTATQLHFESFLHAIEPAVLEAQEEGSLTNELPAADITELLHSTFYGVLTRLKSGNDPQKAIQTMQLLFHSLRR